MPESWTLTEEDIRLIFERWNKEWIEQGRPEVEPDPAQQSEYFVELARQRIDDKNFSN